MSVNAVIAKLNQATSILTQEIPQPDMDVIEWRQTPIGRAVSAIEEAIEILVEE